MPHIRKPTGPGLSGAHAICFKILWKDNFEAQDRIMEILRHIWNNAEIPEYWNEALLKILPKSGDKADPSNCRGIQMLEVFYKILGNILKKRDRKISEKLDHESQCGFRIERGTIDGVWNIRMTIDKRREHGCETWLLLLDLVKAFDRVPRSLLWKFMERLGYPPKFIKILKLLHQDIKVKFEVNGIEKVIKSTIGGKQGDLPFPSLFNLHICCIMMIWRRRRVGSNCTFRTKNDFILGSGKNGDKRKWDEGGKTWKLNSEVELFSNNEGIYADDTGLAFTSRADAELNIPILLKTFEDCGMDIHIKKPTDKKAKTVMLFCAVQNSEYDRWYADSGGAENFGGADLSEIQVGTVRGVENCTIPIVEKAKYLGSILDRKMGHISDVEARISQANGAFASLKILFKNKNISLEAKRAAYVTCVLSILLYGCECWANTAEIRRKLTSFHNRCARTMVGINMWHVKNQRIKTEVILEKLGLRSLEIYMTRRRLRWIGHVSRMDNSRKPKKFLTSWVYQKRPIGRPHLRWADSIQHDFKVAKLTSKNWMKKAEDREGWKNFTKYLGEPAQKKKKGKKKKKRNDN